MGTLGLTSVSEFHAEDLSRVRLDYQESRTGFDQMKEVMTCGQT